MLRTALAVLLAATLLGLSLPVVDDARVGHADSQVRTELTGLESAATDLRARSDPVAPDTPGARVTHSLRLPRATWGSAGIERVQIPAHANGSVRWRVAGGESWSTTTTPPLVAPPDGLTLRASGRHRLTLTLERHNGTAVVAVSRADV